MKVLLDSCVSPKALLALSEAGHEVDWVGNWASDPGDSGLVEIAMRDGWIIATIDKDFGELFHIGRTEPSSTIRLVGFRAEAQGSALASLLLKFEGPLRKGALITAEPWRVRVRHFHSARDM